MNYDNGLSDRPADQAYGRPLSRRRFLRGALVLGGVTAVLTACQQAAAPPAPTTAPAKPTEAPKPAAPAAAATTAPAAPAAQAQATTAPAPAAAAKPTDAPAAKPAATDEGTPKKGGTLRYGLSTDPSNFEPHFSTGAASGAVKLMVYSTLLTYDRDGKMIGDLVDSFGWADDKTYEVKLKPGVMFHDGSTLTPDDVVFTFNRIMDKATAATNAPRLADVDKVEADGNTIRFRLKQVNATLPYVLADNSSMIVSKKWIESGVDPKATMMGTGPFVFVERQPGVAVNMKRNEHYFLPNLPYLDAITFQPMADDNARVTALRSGAVDFIDYVPFTQMDIIQKSSDLVFKSDKSLGFNWLGFVNDMAPVNDQKVRQAFAYGMDRSQMADVAFSGHGSAITGGLLPEGWIGHVPDLENTLKPDFDKAKSLLKEAGKSDLNIDILSTLTYSVISRPAEAAQAQLKNAGINGNLVMQEWLTFRQTVMAGTYPVHVWGSAPTFNDPDFLSDYYSSTGTIGKQLHFKDDQLDQLLIQGRQTVDPAKRSQIYQDVQKRAMDLMPITWLIRREQGEAMQKYVKGFTHLATGSWSQIALREIWLDK